MTEREEPPPVLSVAFPSQAGADLNRITELEVTLQVI